MDPEGESGAARSGAAPPALELHSVVKVYPGGVRALHDVTFAVAAGERACLLGPNGAGKTTIIRLLNGALQPTRGAVRLLGAAVNSPAFLAAKRRVGVVPQGPGMYEDLTAGEYLQLVARLYGRGDPAAAAVPFGLTPYLGRPLAQLSGGFQRRLLLAAALLPAPDVLLLDEPTVGLDPAAARDVRAYLQEMMAGRTTLLCTHNLAEAEALCERVIILRSGRVILSERLEALRRRFTQQAFLAAGQGPAALVAGLATLGIAAQVDGTGARLALPEPERQLPDVLRALLNSGLDVYECRVETPSLEEIFLSTVTGDGGGGRQGAQMQPAEGSVARGPTHG